MQIRTFTSIVDAVIVDDKPKSGGKAKHKGHAIFWQLRWEMAKLDRLHVGRLNVNSRHGNRTVPSSSPPK
jgi:hypothetical protein